jgi:hypothetical protein
VAHHVKQQTLSSPGTMPAPPLTYTNPWYLTSQLTAGTCTRRRARARACGCVPTKVSFRQCDIFVCLGPTPLVINTHVHAASAQLRERDKGPTHLSSGWKWLQMRRGSHGSIPPLSRCPKHTSFLVASSQRKNFQTSFKPKNFQTTRPSFGCFCPDAM